MTSRFEETDLGAIRPISIAGRHSKVDVNDIVDPESLAGDGAAIAGTLLSAMPDILAADALKKSVAALRRARDEGREIIWLIGAHTIKVGLSKYLGALIDRGFITTLASTGSATIHDLELAFFGKTSEDVAMELPAGRFGMSKETATHYFAACNRAAELEVGLGGGFGDYIARRGRPD